MPVFLWSGPRMGLLSTFADPSHDRASAHGVLRRAGAHARAAGASRVEVEASLAGVEFYSANGFVVAEAVGYTFTVWAPIECVLMRTALAAPVGESVDVGHRLRLSEVTRLCTRSDRAALRNTGRCSPS